MQTPLKCYNDTTTTTLINVWLSPCFYSATIMTTDYNYMYIPIGRRVFSGNAWSSLPWELHFIVFQDFRRFLSVYQTCLTVRRSTKNRTLRPLAQKVLHLCYRISWPIH